jgi:hypothetical protein
LRGESPRAASGDGGRRATNAIAALNGANVGSGEDIVGQRASRVTSETKLPLTFGDEDIHGIGRLLKSVHIIGGKGNSKFVGEERLLMKIAPLHGIVESQGAYGPAIEVRPEGPDVTNLCPRRGKIYKLGYGWGRDLPEMVRTELQRGESGRRAS